MTKFEELFDMPPVGVFEFEEGITINNERIAVASSILCMPDLWIVNSGRNFDYNTYILIFLKPNENPNNL